MKTTLFTLCLFLSTFSYAQKERSTKMGQATLNELEMTFYKKDSTANALVLYEQANYYRSKPKNFRFTTEYYKRIKIFNKKGLNKATVTIYTNKDQKELISDIKAITYNLNDNNSRQETYLSKDQIFETQETKRYTKTTFSLPNVNSGSVIEYTYTISSYYIGIKDWYFQSDIPKLKSQLDLAVLGNYKYNKRLIGFLDLDKEESSVNHECIEMPDGQVAACASYSFGMNNIPAFKEEDYMLSKKNYLSKISLDLESITTLTEKVGASYYKKVKNYTKTWKDADKTLRLDFLNNQGSKKSFFKKKLPKDIFSETNTLAKAKKIYTFIQNHYTWNEKNWISSNIKVKESFDRKSGSVDEINLSLYNILQAAKIESYITLVSTRNNGKPTKLFPVLNDFNYIVIKVIIDEVDYFLDATDKYLPFGTVPFKCLNGAARVFDFKKGSYWQPIPTNNKNNFSISSSILLNENGNIEVTSNVVNSGYFANDIRHKYNLNGKEAYIENLEVKLVDFEIEDYSINYNSNLEKPIKESFTLLSDDDFSTQNKISLKPYLISRVSSNPFKLKERLYPVDFGYKKSITQRINIEIPKGFSVTKLPKEIRLKLPNNGGSYIYKVQQKEKKINIYSKYIIHKKIFSSEEYFGLKDFFKKIIEVENSEIILEKI
jgi:hypothetical protein